MRKTITAVSALALILSTTASPAFAVVDPTFGGTYPALDAECDLLLNPGENSGFTTFALVDASDRTATGADLDDVDDRHLHRVSGLDARVF